MVARELMEAEISAELGEVAREVPATHRNGYRPSEPGRVSRSLRLEGDLSSEEETLRGRHDPGNALMS